MGDTVDYESLKQVADKIIYYLAEQGYIAASVAIDTVVDSTGITVTYLVNTGHKRLISNWQFRGNEFFGQEQLSTAIYQRKQTFSTAEMARAQRRLTNLYQRHGFPFVDVQLLGVAETADKLTPIIKITEGPKVKISFLKFLGGKVPELLLQRYAGFKKPIDYNITKINQWQRQLKNTGWISVDSTDIVFQDSSYGIRFWITNQRTNEIFVIVGYAPGRPHLTGWTRLSILNLFNSGRIFRAGWYSAYQETQYQLQYTEPWLFNLPLSLTGEISHTVCDTLYALSSFLVTGTVKYEWGQFSMSSGLERIIAGRLTKTTIWAGTGFTFDNWDDNLHPKKGIFFNITSKAGNQSVDTANGKLIGALEAKLTPVFPLTSSISWYHNIGFGTVYSALPLTEPELYPVGGINNVRGYRENSYRTRQLVWWICEPRYYFSNNSRIHLFYDLGFFIDRDRKPIFLSGYGLGGRWSTKLGLLGIDIAFPFAGSWLQGKIHFTVQTGF